MSEQGHVNINGLDKTVFQWYMYRVHELFLGLLIFMFPVKDDIVSSLRFVSG